MKSRKNDCKWAIIKRFPLFLDLTQPAGSNGLPYIPRYEERSVCNVWHTICTISPNLSGNTKLFIWSFYSLTSMVEITFNKTAHTSLQKSVSLSPDTHWPGFPATNFSRSLYYQFTAKSRRSYGVCLDAIKCALLDSQCSV